MPQRSARNTSTTRKSPEVGPTETDPCPGLLWVGERDPGLEASLRSAAPNHGAIRHHDLAEWMAWTGTPRAEVAQSVLLVAASELKAEAWPFVRVRLSEAGRFFIVVLPAGTGSAGVVAALREGAYDAIAAHEPPERWRAAIDGTFAAERLWARLFDAPAPPAPDGLVGRSPAFQNLREMIARIGPTSASVLVLGESGTGKERVAQALHDSHPGSAKRPFIAINCTALPRDLLEGELFGAAKGAYTSAVADRPGLVEQAHGGTLFLDEIGDLDRALQPKLLRFLETRRARRLGANADYSVDVRIVAATNADLRARVAAGQFREDLYYRLADITLALPPLRERAEDIPLLCRHFMHSAAERHGRLVTSIEPALVERLQAWSWPGNIRELRSTLERLVILSNGPVLRDGAWSPPTAAITMDAAASSTAEIPAPAAHTPSSAAPLNKRQRRELALRLLNESGGDQSWVAARLGIHPTTLYRWRLKSSG